MGNTENFFKEKKSWSVVKDRILDYYLIPYTSKVLRTGKPIIFCDCFAGKGRFDDGEAGSPLIIAELIKRTIDKQPVAANSLHAVCIEKKYHHELSDNLTSYAGVSVMPGTFEENLSYILSLDRGSNLFLYVDPYGIKSLNLGMFAQIRDKQFSSFEMLMNFNSAGFLREGCRLLKHEIDFAEEMMDYEADDDANTKENMDSVAGGEYWQDILKEVFASSLDFYEAEERFVAEYSRKMKQLFKYTVNIPIKVKSTHLPKYRLIFGSNHEDGLILMADNMNKKWNEIVASARAGQQVLFDYEFPDVALSKGFDLQKDVLSIVSVEPTGTPLRSLIVGLIQKYGITFTEAHYKKTIRGLEKDDLLIVDRIPPQTATGKPATSMDYGEYRIMVRAKR